MRGEAEELALDYAGERQGRGYAGNYADGYEQEDFAHDHPDDVATGGAEGHANADFAGALGDGVGHDAVEADDSEESGEETEDGGEAGDHALGGEGVVDGHFGGAHGVDGEIRIHVAVFRTDGSHQLVGTGGGADEDGHSSEEAVGEIGNEGLRGNFVAETGVLEILDDADDFHVGGSSGVGAETEVEADGISSREVFLRKLLVDHNRCGRPVPHFRPVFDLVVVVGPEVAARDDGHAQSGKIVGADGVHVGLGVLIGLRRSEALGGHAAVPLVVFENAHGGEADGLNSRNGTERFGELRIENLHALCSVAVERRVDLEGHEPLRGKAGAEIAQVRKTANEKTGSYQEQEGKRHLRDDQGFSQAIVAAAANDSSGLVLQCSCDVGLGGLKSRYEAEDDSGEDGHGKVEEKNAKIGRAGNVHAAGIGRQIDFHKGAVGLERKG